MTMQADVFPDLVVGDDPRGRGDRGPIPLHLILETKQELTLTPTSTRRWEIELTSIVQ